MSRSHAALIVDADPQGLECLVYGFQGAGWRITACAVPETASLLVRASGAEIVVIASRGDHEKTHSLLHQLRDKETFRALPVLVLGPEELRAPLKDRGDFDLLPLPAFVRDVLTASAILVEATTRNLGDDPRYESAVTPAGTLSLIRTMNGLARSGVLRLEHEDRHGEIWFHEGELTAAQFGQLEGGPAIHHVLLWNDGALELLLRPVARRGQLHQTAHQYLEDLGRFQRDFAHATQDIGPPASVYARNEERLLQSTGDVPAEVTPVVRLCDGQRKLCDVIDESPFRVLDTVRILARLVELGILVRTEPKPDIKPTVARSPLDDFWETALIVGPESLPPAPARIGGTPAPAEVEDGASAEPDRRDPSATRREGQRRSRKQTLDLGMPSEVSPPLAATALPPPETTAPNHVGIGEPGTRASGTLEVRKADRRAHPSVQPRVQVGGDLAAVVVDRQVVPSARAAGPGPDAPSPRAPAPAAESPATRITGVIQVAPSGRTTRPNSVPGRISIQLDASLVSQVEPPSATKAAHADLKPAASGTRVTGELHVAPSGKSPRTATKAERASSSFQIDPSLSQSSLPTEAPAAPQQETRHRPPSGGVPVEEPHGSRRPSGGFSAIESDFFAREAELYQQESTDPFTDLEDDRARPEIKKAGPTPKGDKNRHK